MLWAVNDNEERILAFPKLEGFCPVCGNRMIAKCGTILAWHWSHTSDDCDKWSEPESDWHIGWKNKFPKDWQEVIIGNHRADVKTPKLVVELQSSNISETEIEQRERHYKNMVWLVNAQKFKDSFKLRRKSGFFSFRWKWPRKSWKAAKCPLVFDFGDRLIHIKALHMELPCGGWGVEISESEFLMRSGLF